MRGSLLVCASWLALGACSVVPPPGSGGAHDGGAATRDATRDGDGDECADGGRLLWFQDCDADGDGHAGGIPITACTAPESPPLCDGEAGRWVTTHGDCNDLQAGISSFAREACNGQDDDCNGLTDDGPEPAEDCSSYPGVESAECAFAACAIVCLPGHVDCDGDPGCEHAGSECDVGGGVDGGVDGGGVVHPTGTLVSVSAGLQHSCATFSSGNVLCWGGTGSLVPVYTGTVAGVVGVATTSSTTCALSDVGEVLCFGGGPAFGIAGLGETAAFALGGEHGCAVRVDGAVECWGRGTSGELGDGRAADSATAVSVPGIADAVSVAAGTGASCAAHGDGTVSCWGVRQGSVTAGIDRTPVVVTGVDDATSVALGDRFACALRASGHVACWGVNTFGQLGDGTTSDRSTPADVAGLEGVVELTLGDQHACARRTDGTVSCWGVDDGGEIGDGDGFRDACGLVLAGRPIDRCAFAPVVVPGLVATQLAAGGGHTCALQDTGDLVCWGTGGAGELGDGTRADRTSPVRVVF